MKYKVGDLVTVVGPSNTKNMSASEREIGWLSYVMGDLVGKTFTVMREPDIQGIIPRRGLSGMAASFVWHPSWLAPMQAPNLFLGE